MDKRIITCIECPVGCQIEVSFIDGKVNASGFNCKRGKLYAENEVVCPRRIITSTVRAENGEMVSVKTNKPVKKQEMFEVMKKINLYVCKLPVKIGDVLIENITEDISLVATCNLK